MSAPEESRAVRQLRHDVDDVYALLTTTEQTVSTIAGTQRRHTGRFEEVQQALDLQSGRLDRIEETQRQILDLLRGQQGLSDSGH